MLVLLPPSETKRSGGEGAPLDLARLAHPSLTSVRERVITALVALSTDPDEAARVLKLGKTQRGDVDLNAVLPEAATMPAVDRYTGVLYDALDAATLDEASRRWLATHVQIQSAAFGLVAADDPVPSYRLSAAASVPGAGSGKRVWADAVSEALRVAAPDFVLDLRSEAYSALGPVPHGLPSAYVRVVAEGPGGVTRALNHFNKRAKGELVRRLASSRAAVGGREDLFAWAEANDVDLRPGERQEMLLVER
ncbi:YaaA family protein [Microbacterium xanthum]|uniref:YaaA family protein n=1 Tax=Microbacterium xanthum TaxID=3079794 RepID=UPI002AD38410|nr:peroxide stress protein YaaA [Microbacterium sp. KSW-48]MDZ8171243.1 peroxide stress protein YaaA [Microbacterium sp. KSW-48]